MSMIPPSPFPRGAISTDTRSGRTWVALLAAAVVAAGLSWEAGESVAERYRATQVGNPQSSNITPAQANAAIAKNGALACGLQGALLGLALGVAGGLLRGSAVASALAGLTGLVLGGVAGGGGGMVVFPVYLEKADPMAADLLASLVTHAAVWGLVGLAAGLAFGLGRGGGVKTIVLASAGALIGAAAGAGVYEIAGAFLFPLAQTGLPIAAEGLARLVAHAAVDLCAAVGVGLALGTEAKAAR